jgi:hypothetical protein
MMPRIATLLLLAGLAAAALAVAPEAVQAAARLAAWACGAWSLVSFLSLGLVVTAFRAVAHANETVSRDGCREQWLAAVTVPGTARR